MVNPQNSLKEKKRSLDFLKSHKTLILSLFTAMVCVISSCVRAVVVMQAQTLY